MFLELTTGITTTTTWTTTPMITTTATPIFLGCDSIEINLVISGVCTGNCLVFWDPISNPLHPGPDVPHPEPADGEGHQHGEHGDGHQDGDYHMARVSYNIVRWLSKF